MISTKFLLATFSAFPILMGMANANSGDGAVNFTLATWFNTGLGACGAVSQNTDFVVALSTTQYGTGSHCFKPITVTYEGKSVEATVVDKCEGCSDFSIDLSPSAFEALAPLSDGRIQVTWNYE